MRVLVTDGGTKHGSAAVRALGKRGVEVSVLASHWSALALHSRYCRETIICPDPVNEQEFVEFVRNLIAKDRYDLLISIGYRTTQIISKYRDLLLPHVQVHVADYEKVKLALSKRRTYQLAEKLGVPYPETAYPESMEQVQALSDLLSYPVVIKATHEIGVNLVDYARNAAELVPKYSTVRDRFRQICLRQGIADSLPMLQQYVHGGGYGFFALYQNGICKRVFMHRRIREFPPSGGASTCAESYYSEELKQLGKRLLDELQWHGVAMVEFRKEERDGKFRLLEINPKFWGSLDLAVAAGVNFPYYLCEMAMGKCLDYSEDYDRNLRFSWPLSGDIQYVMKKPSAVWSVMQDCVLMRARTNLSFRDPCPNLLELCGSIYSLVSSIRRKNSQ